MTQFNKENDFTTDTTAPKQIAPGRPKGSKNRPRPPLSEEFLEKELVYLRFKKAQAQQTQALLAQ